MNCKLISVPFLFLALNGAAVTWPATPEGPAGAAVVLPQKLVAGQPATLAVLTADGRLAADAVVEFSGGERVTTDATGRATFPAPAEPGILLAQLPGTSVGGSATVLAPTPKPPEGVHLDPVPRLVAQHDRFTVSGAGFRGQADANHVRLGDQPALVLAASPAALVILPGPHTPLGPTQLTIQAGGRSLVSTPTTLVALELSSEKPRLAPKERGILVVHVRGADQPLEVEIRNLTPEVVKLLRGDLQRVTTRGGKDNAAVVEMKGLRAGDFSLSVRLIPPAAGLPDVETAREYLLAARQRAPVGWDQRVERLVRRLERNPQEALKVRNDLEKMLAERPKGGFGRLLESAWEALLNR